MTIPPKKVVNADAGDADHVGGNDWDDVADYMNNVDKTGPVVINTETNYRSGKLGVTNPANTFEYKFVGDAILADRNVTLPLLTAGDTLVTKDFAQTLTNKTISGASNTLTNIANSSLSADVVLETQANTFGDFDQTFKDNRIRIENPAGTFETALVNTAIAADRNLSLPLLTGNDTIVAEAHTTTLTNKTIEAEDNTVAVRDWTVKCFKLGTTYYAIEHDGTIISTSATAETVLAAAIAQKGTIYLANTQTDNSGATTDWNLSGAFTGFTIVENTHLVADPNHNVRIIVPNGFTGTAITIDGSSGPDENISIYGIELREAGSPANDWTGIKLQMNSATDYMYFCKFKDIAIINPSVGIELETSVSDSAFITSCTFENIMIWHPVIGVLFDERPNAPISECLFKDVWIQTDSTCTHGFKDVYGVGNTFIHCGVWDEPATTICMNIKSTAQDTHIIGGRLGRAGTIIDQGIRTWRTAGRDTGLRDNHVATPDLAKYGTYYGIAPTVGEGMLNGRLAAVVVGTGTDAGAVDTTGQYRTFSTGATNNSLTGVRCSNGAFRRSFNSYFKTKIRTGSSIANLRIFAGFVATNSAPASAADPLNALAGVALWYDSAVNANWRRRHNDSSGASVSDDTSVAVATTTAYEVEIFAMSDTKFRFVFNGTATDISTDIPSSTIDLAWWVYAENTTGSNRTFDCYYVTCRADK